MDGLQPENEESRKPQGDVRIAILEDHRLLSASISVALEANGFQVSAPELTDLESVSASLTNEPPAIALLDLDLGPFGSGEDVLPVLLDLGCRVVLVTGVTDEAMIGRALNMGAWGWVPKTAPIEDLLEAVFLTMSGEPLHDDVQRDRLVRLWRKRRETLAEVRAPFERLTRRERAVLGMLQEGRPVDQIAAASFVSEATVRSQVRAILTKLGVKSQLAAVAKARAAGWVPDT